jgi:hypothetical protein
MKSTIARVHTVLAWLAVLGSIVQFFMIALFIFNRVNLEVHATTGRVLEGVAALMLIAALIIRTSRRTTWYSVAVFLLLVPIQGILAYVDLPGFLNALHAVTGTLILWLSYLLAAGNARATIPVNSAFRQTSTG